MTDPVPSILLSVEAEVERIKGRPLEEVVACFTGATMDAADAVEGIDIPDPEAALIHLAALCVRWVQERRSP